MKSIEDQKEFADQHEEITILEEQVKDLEKKIGNIEEEILFLQAENTDHPRIDFARKEKETLAIKRDKIRKKIDQMSILK